MKTYYTQDNIGLAKYTVSHHDGESTHKDGSPFYGVALFTNKKKVSAFIASLLTKGYSHE